MENVFPRIVSLLLAACLLVDPSLGTALSKPPSIGSSFSFQTSLQDRFQQETITQALLAGYTAKNGIATSRQASDVRNEASVRRLSGTENSLNTAQQLALHMRPGLTRLKTLVTVAHYSVKAGDWHGAEGLLTAFFAGVTPIHQGVEHGIALLLKRGIKRGLQSMHASERELFVAFMRASVETPKMGPTNYAKTNDEAQIKDLDSFRRQTDSITYLEMGDLGLLMAEAMKLWLDLGKPKDAEKTFEIFWAKFGEPILGIEDVSNTGLRIDAYIKMIRQIPRLADRAKARQFLERMEKSIPEIVHNRAPVYPEEDKTMIYGFRIWAEIAIAAHRLGDEGAALERFRSALETQTCYGPLVENEEILAVVWRIGQLIFDSAQLRIHPKRPFFSEPRRSITRVIPHVVRSALLSWAAHRAHLIRESTPLDILREMLDWRSMNWSTSDPANRAIVAAGTIARMPEMTGASEFLGNFWANEIAKAASEGLGISSMSKGDPVGNFIDFVLPQFVDSALLLPNRGNAIQLLGMMAETITKTCSATYEWHAYLELSKAQAKLGNLSSAIVLLSRAWSLASTPSHRRSVDPSDGLMEPEVILGKILREILSTPSDSPMEHVLDGFQRLYSGIPIDPPVREIYLAMRKELLDMTKVDRFIGVVAELMAVVAAGLYPSNSSGQLLLAHAA
jgi:hypothetical protein